MRLGWLAVGLLGACQGGGEGAVVINEVVAANATGHVDEVGEFDDWLELYNSGSDDVDLSGWTLTDDPEIDVPWPFPAGTTLDAGGYLVVFCDQEPDQGPLHADFKLGRDGETLRLARADGSVVDEVSYPAQPVDDVGWGRSPDGGADFVATDPPTPGEANP